MSFRSAFPAGAPVAVGALLSVRSQLLSAQAFDGYAAQRALVWR